MDTITTPVIMVFEKDQTAIYNEVRHYNLCEGENLLSEKLNVSVFRGFSKARCTYSVKKRLVNKWSTQITGLFPTHDPDLFHGDIEGKKHLVLFRFSNNGNKLRVYLFQNFFTRDITDFLKEYGKEY